MTLKRSVALMLSLLLMLTALLWLMPEAQAEPSTAGCTGASSPDGRHLWGKISHTDPWCERAGGDRYKCRYCKTEVFEQTHAALGHLWGPREYTGHADCTHYGVFHQTCSRCGKISTGNDKPLGHDWDGGVITKQPTDTEEGEITYTCLRDPSHTRTEALPAGNSADGKTYETVRIVWEDEDDKAGLRPSQINMDFYSYGDGKEETKTVTMNAANGWQYTMNGLPKSDAKGLSFQYKWIGRADELPEMYVMTYKARDIFSHETVFTVGYYPGTADPHPGLKLALSENYTISSYDIDECGGIGPAGMNVDFMLTLTNTGNVPLWAFGKTQYADGTLFEWIPSWEGIGDNDELTLADGEVHSAVQSVTLKYTSTFMDTILDFVEPTPDDPQYLGKVTFSIWYDGYEPDVESNDYHNEMICQSNVCTMTVKIPREGMEGNGPESADFCSLTLDSLSDTEAVYTLHACSAHIGTAEAAQELALAGNWAGNAELWRKEIEKQYDAMEAVAPETVAEVLRTDRQAFFDYAKTVQLLFSDEEAAELMQLRCAGICCMLYTAPGTMPSSLSGTYKTMETPGTFDACARGIGALNGSDSEVTELYAGSAAEAMAATRRLADKEFDAQDEVFAQGLDNWRSALESIANPAYLEADPETQALIAAWRLTLIDLCDADENLFSLLYSANPAVTKEHIMDLYKEAALLIGGMNKQNTRISDMTPGMGENAK